MGFPPMRWNVCVVYLRKGKLWDSAITAAQCRYCLEVNRSKEPKANTDLFCYGESQYGATKGCDHFSTYCPAFLFSIYKL